ncbi:hypothetical protein NP233_g6555 [Leucocoprinus birnbaumii]|uniref:BZIP domain-containing protein n=1 Tax=Leucocoprinus birnbaumii TaxID=56174 RepID=A0AAD5YVF6_9AGAR|nr:hypothetical protein NP233_g6555 [Leucocoprinus birnbaumii]
MPVPMHEEKGKLELRTTSPKVREELEHWEHLVFSFEMDKGNEQSHSGGINRGQQSSRRPRRSRSTTSSNQLPNTSGSGSQDADLLAQLAATGATTELDNSLAQLLNSNPYPPASIAPPGYPNHFFPYGGMGYPQLPPVSSLDFAWNQIAQQQQVHPMYNLPLSTPLHPSLPFPNPLQNTPLPPPVPQPQQGNRGGRSGSTSSQPAQARAPSISASSPTASTSSPTAEAESEPEQAAIAEEKRRRNTAASARFRIKKKQRTINLERSVSDLSGRAEELEKEVADLRRENGWLKEIVMLKSSRYASAASAEQRMALGQAVKDAGIDLSAQSAGQASTSTPGASSSRPATQPSEVPSEEESDEEPSGVDRKGKERLIDLFLMSFGRPPSINIGFKPTAPDRGSFPLDHYGECKVMMTAYMKCLKENESNSTPCRALSRDYLDCRMQKGLMERDEWSNLGLQNVDSKKTGNTPESTQKS